MSIEQLLLEGRLKKYQQLVKYIDKGELFYICQALNWPNLRIDYPELWHYKPKTTDYAWFDLTKRGMQKRRKILLKAIQLCQQLLLKYNQKKS